jgi:hypothetical protein
MVGAATFMDAAAGNLTSLGPFAGRGDFFYLLAGHTREFLDRSEIPLALLRQAVKEFMASGGQLPTCIEWRNGPNTWAAPVWCQGWSGSSSAMKTSST